MGSSGPPADPHVYVVDHIRSTWPSASPEVTFLDPAGAALERLQLTDPDRTDYAVMPQGGSVSVFTDRSASPSASYWARWTIDGVKPGEHFVFDGTQPHLPSDCSHRTITAFTIDPMTSRASWDDPDAGSVDARIVHRSSGCQNQFPPIRCSVNTDVDGSTATSVLGGPDLTSVDVIACPNEHYDDIRSLLTASLGPS
jgi:hypothetical protein